MCRPLAILENWYSKEKRKDATFKVSNIYYEFNSALLTPESQQELSGLVTLLQDNQTIVIEISSHTDNIGTDEANTAVSQRRAQGVVDFLVQKGIDGSRLRAKGYGKTKPVATNSNEAGRTLNRRTEFKVVGELK